MSTYETPWRFNRRPSSSLERLEQAQNLVLAFRPRSIDPPHFVAETRDELVDKVGEYIGGEQCDGCGNSTYLIVQDNHYSDDRHIYARCAVDPSDSDEFKHPEPCGRKIAITLWNEDDVVF